MASYQPLPGAAAAAAGAGEKLTFEKILHKGSSVLDNHFGAIMKKDHRAQKAAADEYFGHWDSKLQVNTETPERRAERTANYATISRQYYNLVTDLYEYGWSQSFHFCRFAYGEPFRQAIARHEHWLAAVTGLRPGMRVLDVGCGVGGPAREIANFSGAHITGLNINEYQVERCRRYAEREGLSGQLDFVQGDFMNMPFEPNTFDAVYVIEATVHAPSLEAVYRQIARVLKPGGMVGIYEWVTTDSYDDGDVRHRKIRLDIEQGDGIASMRSAGEAVAAFRAAGFELLDHGDLAAAEEAAGRRPWYWPLDGNRAWSQCSGPADFLGTFRMTRLGRTVTHAAVSVLETLRVAPPGTAQTSESLQIAAEALVAGGKENIFTPMYLMVGRKPLEDGVAPAAGANGGPNGQNATNGGI